MGVAVLLPHGPVGVPPNTAGEDIPADTFSVGFSVRGRGGPGLTPAGSGSTGESSGIVSWGGWRNFSRILPRLGPHAGTKGLGAAAGSGTGGATGFAPTTGATTALGGLSSNTGGISDLGTARFTST